MYLKKLLKRPIIYNKEVIPYRFCTNHSTSRTPSMHELSAQSIFAMHDAFIFLPSIVYWTDIQKRTRYIDFGVCVFVHIYDRTLI
jgi:hypothetical protein